MNDIQFVEAARALAQHALKNGGTNNAAKANFLARHLLARSLQPQEWLVVEMSLDDLETYYKSHPKDANALLAVGESKPDPTLPAAHLAAWTMLSNQMMNLDEVLNK